MCNIAKEGSVKKKKYILPTQKHIWEDLAIPWRKN